jgi:uncharacterized protein (DUF697 family)
MKLKWHWYGIGALALLVVAGQMGHLLQSWQFVGALMLLATALLFIDRTPGIDTPTRGELKEELKELEELVTKIRSLPQQKLLQSQITKLAEDIREYNSFQIAVYGTKGVGKTALITALKGIVKPRHIKESRKLVFIETSNLAVAQTSDLILFVIDGVLKASEYRELLKLREQQKRVLVIINKSDCFLPSEIELIKADILEHTAKILAPEDVIACASAPTPIKVKQSDNKQWLEPVPPDVKTLKQRLEDILWKEWDDLQVNNLHFQVKQIRHQAQSILYQDYRREGEKVIQKYQWLTGATIFANPLPGLDLLANAAISTQMLVELSQAYDRQITTAEAKTMASILAQAMLKLGIVELLTTTIGNMIKFSTLTFAIGGSLQAFTAAYLTRVAGISFMKYIEQEMPPLPDQPKSLEVLCEETYRAMESQPLIRSFLQEATLQIAAPKS